MEKILQDRLVYQFLETVDADLAEAVRCGCCVHCGGRLDRADFARKPRGGPKEFMDRWTSRESFCCDNEGCRKRHTPPSARFLGRKVYVGVVVVLAAAMMHGLDAWRLAKLHDALGIDGRTLKRWRQWWLSDFVRKPFWKAHRGRFMPVLDEAAMPFCLLDAFNATRREGLIRLMEFLSPITTQSGKEAAAM
jgi:hypothetical protein